MIIPNGERYNILQGDSYEVLKQLPSDSIDMCVTSPPYYGLRDYNSGEEEIGHEQTPMEYVQRLNQVFNEVNRVLKPTGTLWLNLGDTYNRNKEGNTEIYKNQKLSQASKNLNKKQYNGLPNKSLIGIPWRVAFALQDYGWVLRNDIIWHKPNPMPNSVTDRCSSSHEYIFLFSKKPSGYYFDYLAIEEPAQYTDVLESRKKEIIEDQNLLLDKIFKNEEHTEELAFPKFGGKKYPNSGSGSNNTYSGKQWCPKQKNMNREQIGQTLHSFHVHRSMGLPDKSYVVRRKRDVWTIPIKGYSGAHFATFPERLVEPCILAGCPKDGIVLDPFNGAGTTGVVALKNNRKYIGIELNQQYIDISRMRIAKETAQQTFDF